MPIYLVVNINYGLRTDKCYMERKILLLLPVIDSQRTTNARQENREVSKEY